MSLVRIRCFMVGFGRSCGPEISLSTNNGALGLEPQLHSMIVSETDHHFAIENCAVS